MCIGGPGWHRISLGYADARPRWLTVRGAGGESDRWDISSTVLCGIAFLPYFRIRKAGPNETWKAFLRACGLGADELMLKGLRDCGGW